MFLISKIVRGRRLLQQLEQEEEKEKAAKAHAHLMEQKVYQRTWTIGSQRRRSSQLVEGEQQLATEGDQPQGNGLAGHAGAGAADGRVEMEMREIGQQSGERIQWAMEVEKQHNQQQRRQRAVRQRTDSSLPSADEELITGPREEHAQQAMRRTSSMPSICESIEKRTGGGFPPRRGMLRPVRHYNYEDKLSKMQKRALRFTWQRLLTRNGGKRIEAVFEEVFDRMMRSLPIMREMFNTRTFISAMSRCDIATPRDHARLIVKMFEAAIKNLEVEERKRTDTASEFNPHLLGKGHCSLRPYGFTSALWEAFGEAVIDVVLNQEAVRDLPGASQAWVVLTACLVDQLRAGFESVRECPSQQQQQKCRAAAGWAETNPSADCERDGLVDRGSPMAGTEERGDQRPAENQQQQQHSLANSAEKSRRNTITLMDQNSEDEVELADDGQQQSGNSRDREKRCQSMMPGDESILPQQRVELRFIKDMTSTEL